MNTFNYNPNDEQIGDLIKSATRFELDGQTRENTRIVLSEYVKFRPVRAVKKQPFYSGIGYVFTRGVRMHPMPIIAAALILAVGAGTAGAAELSLPGDALYPIKVSVNEPFMSALAVSAEAKAKWAIERAERRMEETAVLALSGKLDEDRGNELRERFETHVRDAEAEQEKLESEDHFAATRIQKSLHAALAAHADILAQVRTEIEDEESRMNIDTVIENVSSRTFASARTDRRAKSEASAASLSLEISEDATSTDVSDDDADVEESRSIAKARIEASERLVGRNQRRIQEDTRVRLKAKLSGAQSDFRDAEDALSRGNKKEANSSFAKALHGAIETRAIVATNASGKKKSGKKSESAAAPESGESANSTVMMMSVETPASSDDESTTITIITSAATTSTSTKATSTDDIGIETEVEIEIKKGDDDSTSSGSGKGSVHIDL